MIQRIQTVYLLIITILTVLMLFFSLATIQAGGVFYTFDATGVSTVATQPELIYPTWGLFALTTIIALLALITIFLYKKRVLQIRFCVFNAILLVGFYGVFAFFAWTLKGQMGMDQFLVKFPLVFPLVCLILDYLAIRNIGADEALVRSLERLR